MSEELPDDYYEPTICKTPLPKMCVSYEQLHAELSASQAREAELREKLAGYEAKKILELEQRVKVLTEVVACIEKQALSEDDAGLARYCRQALDKTPQQTAAQIEREHIEWMMKQNEYGFVPAFVRFRRDQCGCLYAEYELQLTDCGGEFEGQAPTLVAIPPLPNESNPPETDLDEAQRRQ